MDQRSITHGLRNRIAIGVFTLLAIATLLLAIFNDKGVLEVKRQASSLSDIQSEINKIEAENKALNDDIHALRTDPAMIEKLAREELRLVKPGEVVLVTPAETQSTPAPAPAPAPQH